MSASETQDPSTALRHEFAAPPGDNLLEDLEGWLRGRQFGGTTVASAHASPMLDEDGDDALYLRLILNDPSSSDSWPIDEVMQMHRELLTRTRLIGLNEQVYLSIEPSTDAPQADDDELAYG